MHNSVAVPLPMKLAVNKMYLTLLKIKESIYGESTRHIAIIFQQPLALVSDIICCKFLSCSKATGVLCCQFIKVTSTTCFDDINSS